MKRLWFAVDRKAQLLKILNNNTYIKLDVLTTKFDVSKKTILNDINYLNEYLSNAGNINIINDLISLSITDIDNFNQYYDDMMLDNDWANYQENRIAHILSVLIETNHSLLIDDIAELMNVSHSTIVNDINLLKRICKPYNVIIEGKQNKGIELKALEVDLRRLIINKFFDYYYNDDEIDQKTLANLQNIQSFYLVDNDSANKIKKYFVVSKNRIDNKCYIDHTEKILLDLFNTDIYQFLFALLQDYFDEDIPEQIKINEILFLTIPIVSSRFDNSLHTLCSDEIKDCSKLFDELSEAFLDTIGININKSIYRDNFFNHFVYLIRRIKFKSQINEQVDVSELTNIDNCLIIEMHDITKNFIKQHFEVVLTDAELSYLNLYFKLFLENNSISNSFKIAIVSNDRLKSDVLKMNLNKIINIEFECVYLKENEFSDNDNILYDLVLHKSNDFYLKNNVMYINDFINQKNVYKFLKFYEINSGKKICISNPNGLYLENFINDKDFYINKQDSNLIYFCEEIINDLYNRAILSAEDVERLVSKIDLKSSDFGNNLLVPHITYNGNKVKVIVGIHKNKLIMILLIPKNVKIKDDVIIQLYDELLHLAKNSKKISDLLKCDTSSMFKIYLTN